MPPYKYTCIYKEKTVKKRTIKEAIKQIKLFYHQNYHKTAISYANLFCDEFTKYLELNNLEYSKVIAEDWLTQKMKEYNGDYSKTIKYYHFVNLLIDYFATGKLYYRKQYFLYNVKKEPCTHIWKKLLAEFIKELELEKKANETIKFTHLACTKFIQFLESKGCFSPNELNFNLCKLFSKNEHCLVLNSKRAYLYRIRQFIRYLARNDYVSNTLEYSINTQFRIAQPIISVISENQRKELLKNKGTTNDMLNRCYAIGTLALYLALRSIDIINLKKSDISWSDKKITITQKKTKNILILPLVPIVGNALADYLLNHRPKSKSPYVFVSHLLPFQRLKSCQACYNASIKLVKTWEKGQKKGLHTFRKSCASRFVNSGETLSVTSSFIGHTSINSIKPYLSLNEIRMKDCALPLGEIGLPEALR